MLKIFAIGNITHDLELRTNPHTGKPMLQFQIASTRTYRDQTGTHPADFVSVKAHGALAEQCASWLGKGSQVAVTGDLETFPDQDPEQRNYRTIIKAKSIQFLSPRQAERIEADQHPEDSEEVC
jgi:single-strand DNA-binding protein